MTVDDDDDNVCDGVDEDGSGDAKEVIKAAKDGVAFDKLAREKSTTASAQNGGSLGLSAYPRAVEQALGGPRMRLHL